MADEAKRGILDSIHSWMRVVLLPVVASIWTVIGAVWGYYPWYYKEVFLPSTAPINITTNVTVKEAGSKSVAGNDNKDDEFEAIEISVTATNPSTRPVYFLSNYISVVGSAVNAHEASDAWITDINAQIDRGQVAGFTGKQVPGSTGRHYQKLNGRLVGWNNIFPATYKLYPSESVSSSSLIYVPKGIYDLLLVEMHIPSTSVPKSAEIVYRLESDGSITPTVYRIGSNKARTEMATDAEGLYVGDDVGLQDTTSWQELSLWLSKPPQ